MEQRVQDVLCYHNINGGHGAMEVTICTQCTRREVARNFPPSRLCLGQTTSRHRGSNQYFQHDMNKCEEPALKVMCTCGIDQECFRFCIVRHEKEWEEKQSQVYLPAIQHLSLCSKLIRYGILKLNNGISEILI